MYSRTHINGYIDTHLRETPEYEAMVKQGTSKLIDWLGGTYHASKMARLAQLKAIISEELVRKIFVASAYFQQPDTFVTATAMMAHHLNFNDKRDAILTTAEMCAVLCWTGAFTLSKEYPDSSMMFQSNLEFPKQLQESINRSMYMPPMVCEPEEVTSNFESGHLTYNDCLILGKRNGHTEDLCLDVINLQNRIPLKLAEDFLCSVEEVPNKPLDTPEKQRNWDTFKYTSYCMYNMIVRQGNKFYLTNKPDTRGRMYAQGYHITSQGSAFKKAMVELHHEEVVDGVPN